MKSSWPIGCRRLNCRANLGDTGSVSGGSLVDVDNDGDLDLVAVTGFDEWVLNVRGDQSPVYQTPSFLFLNIAGNVADRLIRSGMDCIRHRNMAPMFVVAAP